jgi:hypothetical protein
MHWSSMERRECIGIHDIISVEFYDHKTHQNWLWQFSCTSSFINTYKIMVVFHQKESWAYTRKHSQSMFNTMQWVGFSQVLITCYRNKNDSALTLFKFNLIPVDFFAQWKGAGGRNHYIMLSFTQFLDERLQHISELKTQMLAICSVKW